MTRQTSSALVVSISVALLSWAAGVDVARACSASMPVRHVLRWTDGGLLAHADPKGRVVRLRPDGRFEEVKLAKGATFPHEWVDFSRDGERMIVLDQDWSDADRGAGCLATAVRVKIADLETGAITTIKRLASGGAEWVQLSPSGTRAAAAALDNEGAHIYMHVFDLEKQKRLRVHLEATSLWLDDSLLVVTTDDDRRLRVIDSATGGWRAKIPLAAKGTLRVPLRGDESAAGFTVFDERGGSRRLSRVSLEGGRVKVASASWTTGLLPVEVSRDGSRVAALNVDAPGRVDVLDRATGRRVARIRGQASYTAVAFSPDGRRIAVASHEPLDRDDRDAALDPSAFKATNIEVIDLATGKVTARWGARSRSKVSPSSAGSADGGRGR